MKNFEITMGDIQWRILQGAAPQKASWVNTPHFHIDCEIHLISRGNATMEIDGEDFALHEGEACLISPRHSHYLKRHDENFYQISFLLASGKLPGEGHFSEYSHYTGIFHGRTACEIVRDEDTATLIRKIAALEEGEKNEHVLRVLYALLLISLGIVLEQKLPPLPEKESGTARRKRNDPEEKQIIEDFFQRRYQERITVADLARELYKSVPQTHRIVKNCFGESFQNILTKQRMEQARMLVRTGALPFCRIAAACGYSSYNGFLRAFRQYTGKTPEEYRKTGH